MYTRTFICSHNVVFINFCHFLNARKTSIQCNTKINSFCKDFEEVLPKQIQRKEL